MVTLGERDLDDLPDGDQLRERRRWLARGECGCECSRSVTSLVGDVAAEDDAPSL